jgi:hypothetical protein
MINRTITSSPCPQYKWEEDLEYTWSTVRSRRLLIMYIPDLLLTYTRYKETTWSYGWSCIFQIFFSLILGTRRRRERTVDHVYSRSSSHLYWGQGDDVIVRLIMIMSHLNPIFGRETSQWLFTDMLYRIHIAMSGIWTLVVICTDFLEKSTNRTITSSPCPQYKWEEDLEYTCDHVYSRSSSHLYWGQGDDVIVRLIMYIPDLLLTYTGYKETTWTYGWSCIFQILFSHILCTRRRSGIYMINRTFTSSPCP